MVVRWVAPERRTTPLVADLTFGRARDADVELPGDGVSRRHASVAFPGAVPVLRDLQSRNGTWVNARRIEERPIGPGDVVRIGCWVGVVLEMADPSEVADLRAFAAGWYGGPTLGRAIAQARKVAASTLPILIQGETGTGKEGMAMAIHAWSGRAGPLIAANCGAIPEALAEGELFGYRKGAFTGAEKASPGYFRAAEGGTLFLDEIQELPLAVQTKLLRVLEQQEVHSLGEVRPSSINVRVVCASQEDLLRAVEARRFRADLFARIDGLTVTLPPLRDRKEDIAPLFSQLLERESEGAVPAVDAKFLEALLAYDWPLNVRELVLLTRRLVAVHAGEGVLQKGMLPERMLAAPRAEEDPPRGPEGARFAGATPFDRLVSALRMHRGNLSKAAEHLGVSRAKAYRLIKERPDFDLGALRDFESP